MVYLSVPRNLCVDPLTKSAENQMLKLVKSYSQASFLLNHLSTQEPRTSQLRLIYPQNCNDVQYILYSDEKASIRWMEPWNSLILSFSVGIMRNRVFHSSQWPGPRTVAALCIHWFMTRRILPSRTGVWVGVEGRGVMETTPAPTKWKYSPKEASRSPPSI